MGDNNMRRDILDAIGQDSYSSDGIEWRLKERGYKPSTSFHEEVQQCIDVLVAEGKLEKGLFFSGSLAITEGIGVWDCYRATR